MSREYVDLAEKLLAQLRDEMVEAQRTRAQVIGFKITFVSTAIALLGANFSTTPREVWLVPAFAAFFFDLLINAYSVSIKRLGMYCRHHLEPLLKKAHGWPETVPTWEEFAASQKWSSRLFILGNVGITSLSVLVAIAALLSASSGWRSILLAVLMTAVLGVDYAIFVHRQEVLPPATP